MFDVEAAGVMKEEDLVKGKELQSDKSAAAIIKGTAKDLLYIRHLSIYQ